METATLTAKVNRWLREHLAIKTPAKLLGGLALGALLITAVALPFGSLTDADEPARPLSSGQNPGYCEIDGSCYEPPFLGVLSDSALTTDTPTSSVQFEYWPEVGLDSYAYHRFMVNQGKVASPSAIDLNEYWPEVGFDSYTYHRFMSEQGKVGSPLSGAVAEIDDVEAMVIYGYSASIARVLNEGKLGRVLSGAVASPSSIDLNEVWPGIDDAEAMVIYGYPASIARVLNEGKVGRVRSTAKTGCYPELDIC